MSKKESTETRTKIDDLNDSLTKAEMKVQNNKKIIMWACVIAAVLVAAVLGYIYLIYNPGKNKADTAYGVASSKEVVYQINATQLDSAAAATQQDAVIKAYETAAAKGHNGGNNAKLMAAVNLFKKGDYNKALTYLKDYDTKDDVIAITSKTLEGDCYVNLDKFEDAIKCFQAAAKLAKGNATLQPYCWLKEATVQRHLGNFAAEADLYKQIIDTYPEYAQVTGENYEAFYERAKIQAEGKK
ncbi:MAG: hypothetical protein NC111_04150 [Bacteroides sp.]|nr:hypothetical protein [Bacteroides sp.]MCM1412996.1 hypothetical protein [Bacteroides sp.]MCM1471702.1 hypothetical protein [Bacteroides sp.]